LKTAGIKGDEHQFGLYPPFLDVVSKSEQQGVQKWAAFMQVIVRYLDRQEVTALMPEAESLEPEDARNRLPRRKAKAEAIEVQMDVLRLELETAEQESKRLIAQAP
jgi:hypothetical protein